MKGYGSLLAAAAIAGLLLVSALAALPAISDRTPFFTRGEPREALVVQTIYRGDGFILPLRNGDELPSKPPMFHWLAALASLVQGHLSEGSIRFPGLVAALVSTAATAAAAWAWWGPGTAALSAVVLGTSFQWLASSVSARVDMILAAAITLALLLFAQAIETGRRIPVTAFALLTIATLTKGPVGLLLPCAIAVLTLVLRGELRFVGWRELRLLALAAAAAGLWYLAATLVGGEAFVAKQILMENLLRVIDAEGAEAGHIEPFWFYLPLLMAGLAPWSLFVPGLAAAAYATANEPLPPEPGAPAESTGYVAAPVHGRDPHLVFALVWALVPFVLFSIAGSKRAVYLLPAYPACAMLIAAGWTRVLRAGPGPLGGVLLMAAAALSAALLAVTAATLLAGVAGLALEGWLRGLVSDADVNNVVPMLEAAREHLAVVLPCSAAVLACAWITWHSARRGRWARVFAATAVAMLALSATISTTLLPALASKRSTRSFVQHLQTVVPQSAALSFYRAFDYGAVFYWGVPIPVRQALADVPNIDGAWLLTWPALLPALTEEVRRLDTGGEAAGAYEVDEAIASEDHDPSNRSSLILVRIVRRIGDEHSGGN